MTATKTTITTTTTAAAATVSPIKMWYGIVILWAVFKPATFNDDCNIPYSIPLEENVPKDTLLYKFRGGTWALDKAEPPGYLDVAQNLSTFYLKSIKDLDSEEMKRKYIFLILKCNGKHDIPLSVYIKLKNEFYPQFTQSEYRVSVKEDVKLSTVVFRASDYTSDKDFHEILLFSMKEHDIESSGGLKPKQFTMNDSVSGEVYVVGNLDFEQRNQYIFNISVKDSSFSNSARLVIDVEDIDDMGPIFIQRNKTWSLEHSRTLPTYYYTIQSNYMGEIDVKPELIKAVDIEKEHYNVKYSLETAMPSALSSYFQIDADTGMITQIKQLNTNISQPGIIIIKAEDVSALARSSIAALFILLEVKIPQIQIVTEIVTRIIRVPATTVNITTTSTTATTATTTATETTTPITNDASSIANTLAADTIISNITADATTNATATATTTTTNNIAAIAVPPLSLGDGQSGIAEEVYIGVLAMLVFIIISLLGTIIYLAMVNRKYTNKNNTIKLKRYVEGGINSEEI